MINNNNNNKISRQTTYSPNMNFGDTSDRNLLKNLHGYLGSRAISSIQQKDLLEKPSVLGRKSFRIEGTPEEKEQLGWVKDTIEATVLGKKTMVTVFKRPKFDKNIKDEKKKELLIAGNFAYDVLEFIDGVPDSLKGTQQFTIDAAREETATLGKKMLGSTRDFEEMVANVYAGDYSAFLASEKIDFAGSSSLHTGESEDVGQSFAVWCANHSYVYGTNKECFRRDGAADFLCSVYVYSD